METRKNGNGNRPEVGKGLGLGWERERSPIAGKDVSGVIIYYRHLFTDKYFTGVILFLECVSLAHS